MKASASHAPHLKVAVATAAIRLICHLHFRHHLSSCHCIYRIHHSRHHLPSSACRVMDGIVGHVVGVEVEVRQRHKMAANFCRRPLNFRTDKALDVIFRAMIRPRAEWVDEEDETVPIVKWRQHPRQLLQLRRRSLLRLLKISSFHIPSGGDNDDLSMRKNGDVIVDMIGHVTNLGARNGVNMHRRVVLHHSHNAVPEEEDALWSRRSVVVASVVVVAAALLPTGTLPISMGLIHCSRGNQMAVADTAP